MRSKISFLSSRPPRSNSSLHLSYVLFCDGDPGEYTHTSCLNLWCWNFFLLHKSLMHIHKFMSAFIKFSRPLKYCAHALSVPELSDQLPASKHQLNVKWGHKLLDRVHYQRLADDPELPRGHHRPSVSITSSDSFSVGSNTCMSSLATHLPWAVSFSPCSLAPSSSSFSQTTSSFVIVVAENHS